MSRPHSSIENKLFPTKLAVSELQDPGDRVSPPGFQTFAHRKQVRSQKHEKLVQEFTLPTDVHKQHRRNAIRKTLHNPNAHRGRVFPHLKATPTPKFGNQVKLKPVAVTAENLVGSVEAAEAKVRGILFVERVRGKLGEHSAAKGAHSQSRPTSSFYRAGAQSSRSSSASPSLNHRDSFAPSPDPVSLHTSEALHEAMWKQLLEDEVQEYPVEETGESIIIRGDEAIPVKLDWPSERTSPQPVQPAPACSNDTQKSVPIGSGERESEDQYSFPMSSSLSLSSRFRSKHGKRGGVDLFPLAGGSISAWEPEYGLESDILTRDGGAEYAYINLYTPPPSAETSLYSYTSSSSSPTSMYSSSVSMLMQHDAAAIPPDGARRATRMTKGSRAPDAGLFDTSGRMQKGSRAPEGGMFDTSGRMIKGMFKKTASRPPSGRPRVRQREQEGIDPGKLSRKLMRAERDQLLTPPVVVITDCISDEPSEKEPFPQPGVLEQKVWGFDDFSRRLSHVEDPRPTRSGRPLRSMYGALAGVKDRETDGVDMICVGAATSSQQKA